MKINENNTITGVFNHYNTPSGTIYTAGDLVYYADKLFTCKVETDTSPNAVFPQWELYIGNLANNITSFPQLFDSFYSSNAYVRGDILREYIQEMFPGMNSDGTLKTISSGTLNDIDYSSKYKLSKEWLNGRMGIDITEVPFVINGNAEYFLTTTFIANDSNLPESILSPSIKINNSGAIDSSATFYQEILEVDIVSNTVMRWYRVGQDLQSAIWNPIKMDSSLVPYTTYLNKVVTRYQTKSTLIDNFFTDLNSGDYNMWKIVGVNDLVDVEGHIFFVLDGVLPSKLNSTKYYKLFFKKSVEGIETTFSIMYTPKYATDILIAEGMELKSKNDLKFKRLGGSIVLETDSSDSILVDCLESNKLF